MDKHLVLTEVSSEFNFDQLSEDRKYIVVFKDGSITYYDKRWIIERFTFPDLDQIISIYLPLNNIGDETAKQILCKHASLYFEKEITDPTDDFALSVREIIPAMEEYSNLKVAQLKSLPPVTDWEESWSEYMRYCSKFTELNKIAPTYIQWAKCVYSLPAKENETVSETKSIEITASEMREQIINHLTVPSYMQNDLYWELAIESESFVKFCLSLCKFNRIEENKINSESGFEEYLETETLRAKGQSEYNGFNQASRDMGYAKYLALNSALSEYKKLSRQAHSIESYLKRFLNWYQLDEMKRDKAERLSSIVKRYLDDTKR